MRPLITAGDIVSVSKRNEKICTVPSDAIITPAARDAARDHGITIVLEGAVIEETKGSNQEMTEVCGIDHESLVRLVQNVIASMGIAPYGGDDIRPIDPSGLCVISGATVARCPMPIGRMREVITAQQCASMQAGFLLLDTRPYMHEGHCDLICYIIDGDILCRIDRRQLSAQCGDILYLPSSTHVEISAVTQAKIFYVTCPAKSRNITH
jgi:ethanolamine utilization protein EutQ